MTRRKQSQRTLWEGVVNEDVRALWEPWMVEADQLLEDEKLVEHNSFSEFYLTDLDPRGSMGLGGKEEAEIGSGGTYLTAVDYSTGKIACVIYYYSDGGGGGGLLATAGGLVFGGDGAGSLVAHDAATGNPL